MASDELRQLFVHELNQAHDLEVSGNHMLGDISVNVRCRRLVQLIEEGAKGKDEQLENIAACYRAMGISSERMATDPVVEGLRDRFQTFLAMQPSPDALDMFVLGTSLRLTLLAIAGYDELSELAEILGDIRCVRPLRINLVNKEEYAFRLRRLAYDVGYQIAGDGALVARSEPVLHAAARG